MSQKDFQPLRERAFQFALDTVLFCRTLQTTWEARRIADQLFSQRNVRRRKLFRGQPGTLAR